MAYTKQGFEDGQVLTADQLNHMEDGISNSGGGSGGGISEVPENVVTCDLEGATEDESTVPVNADTLGGELPSAYVKNRSTSRIDITTEDSVLIYFLRTGNVVSYSLGYDVGVSHSMAAWGNWNIGMMPEGYRPIAYFEYAINAMNSSGSIASGLVLQFSTDGTIKFQNMSSSSCNPIRIYSAGSYITADEYPSEEASE